MSDSLIIGWEKKRLVLLSGTASEDEVRVEKLADLDWPAGTDPHESTQTAGLFLKDALQSNGLTSDSAVVSLPRENVILRHLDVPDLPDEELPDLVKLQAATKSTVPADQLLIDFIPLPGVNPEGLRPVLMGTIDKEQSGTIRQTLAAAGIELAGIGIDSVGIAEIATRSSSPEYGKSLLTIALSGKRLELLLIQNGRILMMHTAVLNSSIDPGKAIATEINRATIAISRKVGEVVIGSAVLLSDEKIDHSLFVNRFGENFFEFDINDKSLLHWPPSITDRQLQTSGVALAGLLLNREHGQVAGLDFLNPRRKTVVKDERWKKYGLYAAAGLVAIVFGWYKFSSYRGDLDLQISDLKQKQTDLRTLLQQGKPTLASNQELQEWQDRDRDLTSEIGEVQTALPGTGVAYLEEFFYDVAIGKNLAKYSAKGVAADRNTVEDIYAEFSKLGFAVAPQEIKSGRDPEYPAQFDLVMNRLPEEKKTPGPTSSK